MSALIVNRFQVVKVQQKQGERVVAAFGAAPFALERVHELAVIRQPGQRVVCRLVANLVLTPFSVRDVDSRSDATCDFSGHTAHWPNMNGEMPVAVTILEVRRNAG